MSFNAQPYMTSRLARSLRSAANGAGSAWTLTDQAYAEEIVASGFFTFNGPAVTPFADFVVLSIELFIDDDAFGTVNPQNIFVGMTDFSGAVFFGAFISTIPTDGSVPNVTPPRRNAADTGWLYVAQGYGQTNNYPGGPIQPTVTVTDATSLVSVDEFTIAATVYVVTGQLGAAPSYTADGGTTGLPDLALTTPPLTQGSYFSTFTMALGASADLPPFTGPDDQWQAGTVTEIGALAGDEYYRVPWYDPSTDVQIGPLDFSGLPNSAPWSALSTLYGGPAAVAAPLVISDVALAGSTAETVFSGADNIRGAWLWGAATWSINDAADAAPATAGLFFGEDAPASIDDPGRLLITPGGFTDVDDDYVAETSADFALFLPPGVGLHWFNAAGIAQTAAFRSVNVAFIADPATEESTFTPHPLANYEIAQGLDKATIQSTGTLAGGFGVEEVIAPGENTLGAWVWGAYADSLATDGFSVCRLVVAAAEPASETSGSIVAPVNWRAWDATPLHRTRTIAPSLAQWVPPGYGVWWAHSGESETAARRSVVYSLVPAPA